MMQIIDKKPYPNPTEGDISCIQQQMKPMGLGQAERHLNSNYALTI